MARRRPGTADRQPPLGIECLEIEDAVRASGYANLAGIDEVGRGCWAGPVYAAAVVLSPVCYVDRALLAEVTDSKLLSPRKRERLAADVLSHAAAASLGWAEAPLIDHMNILAATRLAMRLALDCLAGGEAPVGTSFGARRLTTGIVAPDYVLVDGLPVDGVKVPQRAVVRGDRACLSIAAASVVAKVARDLEMRRRSEWFPAFGLGDNKGYGTRSHVAALRDVGLTPLHRRTFAPMKYFVGVRDCVAGRLPPPRERP